MALTPEQRKYYEDLDEMFATPGWRALVKDMEVQVYQNQADALEARSYDQVCELRGEARALAYLINLEAASDAQREMLEDEEDDEVQLDLL